MSLRRFRSLEECSLFVVLMVWELVLPSWQVSLPLLSLCLLTVSVCWRLFHFKCSADFTHHYYFLKRYRALPVRYCVLCPRRFFLMWCVHFVSVVGPTGAEVFTVPSARRSGASAWRAVSLRCGRWWAPSLIFALYYFFPSAYFGLRFCFIFLK